MSTLEAALDRFLEAAREPTRLAGFLPIEERLERAMGRAFAAQERHYLAGFRRHRSLWPEPIQEAQAGDWDPLFTSTELATLRLMEEPLTRAIRDALQLGGDAALADLDLGLSFSLDHPAAVDYINQAPLRVTRINDATREMIRDVLRDGLNEGWSYARISQELRNRFREWRIPNVTKNVRDRSHLIAITETADAYTQGNLAVGRDLASSGLTIEKRWLDVGDERECPVCFSNAAQGWIPLGDVFASRHDGPSAHPGCRCDIEQRVVV